MTGITKFGLMHSRDAENDEPTGSHSTGNKSTIVPQSADNADSGQHPKLIVEPSAAATGGSSQNDLMWLN